MKKPLGVGLLSIVPGLGLIVQGESGKGLLAFALTFLFLAATFSPWELVSLIGLVLLLIAWIVQGYYAVVVAQRAGRAAAGLALPETPVSIPPLPPSATSSQKSLHKAGVTIMKLLPPGEHLKLALHGTTGASAGDTVVDLVGALTGVPPGPRQIRQVFLGITPDDLVVVSTDAFAKPSDLKRIPLSQVSLVESSQGALSDEVVIEIGEVSPLRVGIGRPLRDATSELVAILSQPRGAGAIDA